MSCVAAIFSFNNQKVQLQHIEAMTQAMRHRGPDDEGYVFFTRNGGAKCFGGKDTPSSAFGGARRYFPTETFAGNYPDEAVIALGQRRLATIDLSANGHQPMCTEDRRYWLAHDGTLYNYIELRAELEKLGEVFSTDSDTEVILKAYRRWNHDCLARFNGDWTILIYDTHTRQLFVSRDRFGVKPLYYYQDETQLLLSSEIKGLLAHPAVKTGPNLDYLKDYLESGAKEWLKETAFENIYRFPFAHYARFDLNSGKKHWTPQRYWKLEPNLSTEPFNPERAKEYAKQYYALLKDAVRLRLRCSVPVGCALSGGLDSSSIVYLVDECLKKDGAGNGVKTLSMVHTKNPATQYCDESVYIDKLVKQLDLVSYRNEPEPWAIPRLHKDSVYAFENPADGLGTGTTYLFRLAAEKNVKVTFDGQGGDEQLAGYFSYFRNYFYHLPIRLYFDEARRLESNTGLNNLSIRQLMYRSIYTLAKISPIRRVLKKAFSRDFDTPKPVNEALVQSIEKGLVTLVHYGDARSSSFSVESRLPFLDHRLVAFLANIPACYKIAMGWTKYLARLAFDGKLPDDITWRKDKMGWTQPLEYWLNDPLKKWKDELIANSLMLKTLKVAQMVKNPTIVMRRLTISVWEQVFHHKRKGIRLNAQYR
jgi:asparagine synthase (glutamine-hydrolysing)